MNQGRIEQVGTPDEVFHNPASEFVLTFLGSVNLFHGRVEAAQGCWSESLNGRTTWKSTARNTATIGLPPASCVYNRLGPW